MKRWLMLPILLAFYALTSHAQVAQPDCFFSTTFTTATATPGVRTIYDNRGLASPVCTTWHLTYYNEGFSVVSVELDEAPSAGSTPGTWVTWPNVVSGALPLTATTSGQITLFKYFPWVSIQVTTLTGTGTLRVEANGYRPNFSGDSNASPAAGGSNCNGAATGAAPSGNPCLVAGLGNGTVQPLLLNTSGGQLVVNNVADVDGRSNAFGSELNCATTSINTCPLSVWPSMFNGTTWDRQVKCPTAVPITLGAAGTLQIVAPSAGKLIRVCALVLTESVSGTVQLTEGTGATCGTGTTNITGAITGALGQTLQLVMGGSSVLQTNVLGDGLCLVNGAATVSAGYAQIEQH